MEEKDTPNTSQVDLLTQSFVLGMKDDHEFIDTLLNLATCGRYTSTILLEAWAMVRLQSIYKHNQAEYHGSLMPVVNQLFRGARSSLQYFEDLVTGKGPGFDLQTRLEPPETLTQLIAADIPPPRQLFHGLLHEGMLLFGGKSKRGKSWLIYDLAIALATGKSGFGNYVCHEPTPVLYLALEDGRARLQARAKAIQPGLIQADQFHLRYDFPPLSDGGVRLLTDEIERHHYGLVIIDVLAKLEPAKQGKGDKNYNDIYDMFAPLQELRRKHPFCLAMLTHLRKQDAEDVFDALMGSVAYQGAQDVLWVLERKPKDDYAMLHIRDKDAEDQVIALKFIEGHWEYLGEGEEFEANQDQRRVIDVLREEGGEMSIPQIMKAAGFAEAKYPYVRKLVSLMVKDDLIHRMRQGNYSATIHGVRHFQDDEQGMEV